MSPHVFGCMSGVQSFMNVFSDKLKSDVIVSALKIHSWDTSAGNRAGLLHGKFQTNWFSIEDNTSPRHSIEQSILIAYELAQNITNYSENANCQSIVGAEWWIQKRTATEGISFHYDKDEGLASVHSTMRHPAISTVTYLTDCGAPTLVLNMTTPDGNGDVPEIPTNGYISYPKSNMHLMFRSAYTYPHPYF